VQPRLERDHVDLQTKAGEVRYVIVNDGRIWRRPAEAHALFISIVVRDSPRDALIGSQGNDLVLAADGDDLL
jgi:hypothetical protein